ncbi:MULTISPECIES: acetyl-CoA carboxylase biotin carboxyl carrier protein [Spiribacter]|jgi:acetyl-CoA carboxylase biotin carboxyl carrier protein|uniref:Biotin carboxyl carrier protein of acetyl-CoA carboxylase n=2 Tax=Spiribacter TaxID=1335745 RepID=A0A557RMI4_9GAMM|nr:MULTISPECIES: acetyl-CoA carboxylase biotin carboxyl carrier protein [Spiribacter]KAF0279447.1 acetyl-CoA carboxylase, biotin carboxyl carrier protein [Spiribacter roseus]KAF0281828.1 acetyl-CoA carboxylase, biotin carboxyl carrier protein [Spiribacter roseus]KAF0283860.1 acetyl-CoA carboxylase, biotin carboxyl carrier protein [Spiribacter roseus]KAF0284952.1 acetyl-CoA carboxylase, biotin carboxyl carrier protein [Spiribacter sp. SSL99]TVO66400.1 acetyl-CoA carboxylase biotin carboxyl carr
MDIRKIKRLIELLDESGVNEIEIHEGEESVRINRGVTQVAAPAAAAPPPAPAAPTAPEPAAAEPAAPEPSGHTVRSPMVGTFYRASSPDASAFVEEGQAVGAGDTLCIIEAMKMLNQIESDRAGVVRSILVENGQPVEFDQPLFIIE